MIQLSASQLTIRAAEQPDFKAIAQIYNESIAKGGVTMDTEPKEAVDIQAISQKMTNREGLLVATLNTEVVGWGVIKQYSDRPGYNFCCETSVYLSFSQIGKGYGRALQTAVMERASAYGYRHIVAKILSDNQASVDFHQRFGFSLVGVQKEIGFTQGRWRDVTIMQCLLPPT